MKLGMYTSAGRGARAMTLDKALTLLRTPMTPDEMVVAERKAQVKDRLEALKQERQSELNRLEKRKLAAEFLNEHVRLCGINDNPIATRFTVKQAILMADILIRETS